MNNEYKVGEKAEIAGQQEVEGKTSGRRKNALAKIEQHIVDEQQAQRRSDSERLIKEGNTLEQMLQYFDNDYSELENLYLGKTGSNLIADPYEALGHEIPITKSCSIVIPAYNAGLQLENALLAIQASSFNAKFPQQLEVIVVDDESPKVSMAELIQKLDLQDLNIKVLRQSNGREGKARYSGTLEATGDVMLFTDQDVVYTPTMIEEYMKRHEVLGEVACFGFRYNIDKQDPKLQKDAIANGSLSEFDYEFNQDGRVGEDGMRDCHWLKDSGNGNSVPINTEGEWSWDLPGMPWGLSVSAPRETVLKISGGMDERYKGWGGEDHNLTAELIAEGLYVIPNTGGMALHQEHPTRRDPVAADANYQVLESNLHSSPKRQDPRNPRHTDAQVVYEKKNTRTEAHQPVGIPEDDAYKHAQTLLQMGFYEDALVLFNQVEQQNNTNPLYLHDKAVTLTALGGSKNVEQAVTLLKQAVAQNPDNSQLHISLADAYARGDSYTDSLLEYQEARSLEPGNPNIQFLDGDHLKKANELHEHTTKQYLKRGKPRAALRDYDRSIVLAGEANVPWSVFDKGVALFELQHIPEAVKELERSAELLPKKTWAFSKLGEVYESLNDKNQALHYYEQALTADPNNRDAQGGRERLKSIPNTASTPTPDVAV